MKATACSALVVVCVAASLALPDEGQAAIERGPHQAKIALDSRAIARAKRITIRFRDFPLIHPLTKAWFPYAQWKPGLVNKVGPSLGCYGHSPDESSVTFNGGWSSEFIRRPTHSAIWILTTSAVVFATSAQARRVFDDTRAWTTRYCFVPGAKGVTSVRRVRPFAAADHQAEFRIRYVDSKLPGRNLGSVIGLLHSGRVFIQLTFEWRDVPAPSSFVDASMKKLAARAK